MDVTYDGFQFVTGVNTAKEYFDCPSSGDKNLEHHSFCLLHRPIIEQSTSLIGFTTDYHLKSHRVVTFLTSNITFISSIFLYCYTMCILTICAMILRGGIFL